MQAPNSLPTDFTGRFSLGEAAEQLHEGEELRASLFEVGEIMNQRQESALGTDHSDFSCHISQPMSDSNQTLLAKNEKDSAKSSVQSNISLMKTDLSSNTRYRKPYVKTKSRESWKDDEHDRFLEGVRLYGRDWKKITDHVGSKSTSQVRSHAQKHFLKAAKNNAGDTIPPPRPKKKSEKPYPHKAPNDKTAREEEAATEGRKKRSRKRAKSRSDVSNATDQSLNPQWKPFLTSEAGSIKGACPKEPVGDCNMLPIGHQPPQELRSNNLFSSTVPPSPNFGRIYKAIASMFRQPSSIVAISEDVLMWSEIDQQAFQHMLQNMIFNLSFNEVFQEFREVLMCENPARTDDVIDRVHSHNSFDLSTKEGNEIPTALQRDQVQDISKMQSTIRGTAEFVH